MNINEEVKKLNARIDALEARLLTVMTVVQEMTTITAQDESPTDEHVSKSTRTKAK